MRVTRSVVTDPTTALDHAGRDHHTRDSLPARLVFIAGFALALAALFAWDVLQLVRIIGGTS